MEYASLGRRVEIPAQKVELLQDLPARMAAVEGRLTIVEAQIVQLRMDMNSGFSALSYAINRMHTEIMSRFESVDRRFDAVDKRFERIDARLDAVDRRFDKQDAEIAAIRHKLE